MINYCIFLLLYFSTPSIRRNSSTHDPLCWVNDLQSWVQLEREWQACPTYIWLPKGTMQNRPYTFKFKWTKLHPEDMSETLAPEAWIWSDQGFFISPSPVSVAGFRWKIPLSYRLQGRILFYKYNVDEGTCGQMTCKKPILNCSIMCSDFESNNIGFNNWLVIKQLKIM